MRSMCVVFLLLIGVSIQASAQEPKELTNSLGMKLFVISPGTFVMGSQPNEPGFEDDEILHHVTITRPFYLGAFEVTQSQYQQVMGTNPIFEVLESWCFVKPENTG